MERWNEINVCVCARVCIEYCEKVSDTQWLSLETSMTACASITMTNWNFNSHPLPLNLPNQPNNNCSANETRSNELETEAPEATFHYFDIKQQTHNVHSHCGVRTASIYLALRL